ncbi:hypothetical protein DSECCO2_492170 [anaerobic digester metagenome]
MKGIELAALRRSEAFSQIVGCCNLACSTAFELILNHHILKPSFHHLLGSEISLGLDQGFCRQQGKLGIIGTPGCPCVEIGNEAIAFTICLHSGSITEGVPNGQADQGADRLIPDQIAVLHKLRTFHHI